MILSAEGLRSDTRCTDFNEFKSYLRIPDNALKELRTKITMEMFGHPSTVDFPGVLQALADLCSGHLRQSPSTANRRQPAAGPGEANRAADKQQGARSFKVGWKPKISSPPEHLKDGACGVCEIYVANLSLERQVEHVNNCLKELLKSTLEKEHSEQFDNFRCQ